MNNKCELYNEKLDPCDQFVIKYGQKINSFNEYNDLPKKLKLKKCPYCGFDFQNGNPGRE